MSSARGSEATGLHRRSDVTAAVVFHGALLVAGVVLLQLNSYAWFFSDDWSWLGERDVRSFDDLMRSYNDHWSTVPFVLWRVMYRVFGVGSYTPYLVTLIASHLAIVAMLRVLMRRCGVGPWTASVVAAPLVLLGIGEQAMSLASVLNFNLAIVLVLVHLVIVMDGPAGPGKRDLFGLGVGLVALMTSGIAVLGVAAIGLTTLLRRGPRAAAFHVAPLGTIYLLWYAVFHTEALIVPGVGNATPSQLASWTWEGTSTAAKGLVTTPWGWGAVLAVILWVLVAVAVALSIRGGRGIPVPVPARGLDAALGRRRRPGAGRTTKDGRLSGVRHPARGDPVELAPVRREHLQRRVLHQLQDDHDGDRPRSPARRRSPRHPPVPLPPRRAHGRVVAGQPLRRRAPRAPDALSRSGGRGDRAADGRATGGLGR